MVMGKRKKSGNQKKGLKPTGKRGERKKSEASARGGKRKRNEKEEEEEEEKEELIIRRYRRRDVPRGWSEEKRKFWITNLYMNGKRQDSTKYEADRI